MEYVIYLTFLLLFLPLLLLLKHRPSKRLPPGSMGLPIVGQSLNLLRAMRANCGEQWFQERIRKYGPISKLSIFGTPSIFLNGQAANKLIYTCDGNTFANNQPASIRRLIGDKNLMEMGRDDHRRVRGALVSFLKPEVLKQYVGKMDGEVTRHLEMHWHGKEEVKVMPTMKTLTFDIISTLIFGIERGARRDTLMGLFQDLMEGMLAVPINLPFTRFNRSLRAREKLKSIMMDLISEKRVELEKHGASPHQDLITCLLSIRNEEDGSAALSDEEILDNAVIVMLAGHDTSSILLTFLVRLFATDPSVYSAVLHEQEDIAKSKALGEHLTWEDLVKMKYTWRVAMETLRIAPPVFLSFRRALQDVEYGGYIIPKGWQVIWSASMTQMDETIFPDPTKFDATRSEQGPAPPYSFVAFGAGARICPGYEFARIETLTMVHHLVTKFTWKLSCKDTSFVRDPMPVFNQGLPIHIEEKKNLPI